MPGRRRKGLVTLAALLEAAALVVGSSTGPLHLAAALATMLLVVVMALYWLYDRIVGIDNVKLG